MDDQGAATTPRRRRATAREAKALGHPLRLRILRLCWQRELTNKQLADRLGRDPGTVLYHVRQLTEAGLLEQAPVRAGESGALEKPYRARPRTWWLDDLPPGPGGPGVGPGGAAASAEPEADGFASIDAPLDALREELHAAGPESVGTFVRFALHLSPEDAAELDRRLLALVDEYVRTDDQRLDQPAHGGVVVVHRLAE
ncbi:winged helix-turn-helix domain-containing protein [Streptomyces sp. B6B3]|uniref:ArsR/SmtB family transcription factor n=1 Tax=Streptomyces sp. B6B3 TaxID=3153570 RepID=UPI00325DA191